MPKQVLHISGLRRDLSFEKFRDYFESYYDPASVDVAYLEDGVGQVCFDKLKDAKSCAANPLPAEFGDNPKMNLNPLDELSADSPEPEIKVKNQQYITFYSDNLG